MEQIELLEGKITKMIELMGKYKEEITNLNAKVKELETKLTEKQSENKEKEK